MKRMLAWLLPVLLLGAIDAHAGPRDCDQLRAEIAARIEANGVRSYSLQVVDGDSARSGRVVGRCDGGRRQIVYQRLAIDAAALAGLLVAPPTPRSESTAQDGL